MRSQRIAVTLAIAGAAVLSAAPAFADDGGGQAGPGLSVSPSVVSPGQSVMITATCPSSKPGWNPQASSDAFGGASVTLTAVQNTPGTYRGYAQLPQYGPYSGSASIQASVSASCADGSKVSASVTIQASGAADGGRVPHGGAATGDGASLTPTAGGTATGAAAAAAAGGLGFVAWRRRGARQN